MPLQLDPSIGLINSSKRKLELFDKNDSITPAVSSLEMVHTAYINNPPSFTPIEAFDNIFNCFIFNLHLKSLIWRTK